MSVGIPYLVEYTTVSTQEHVDLSSLAAINSSIDVVSAQMIDQGWSQIGLYASTTFTLDLPIVDTDTISNFALIVQWFEGNAFEIYNTTLLERDPSGDVKSSGAVVVGVPVTGIPGHSSEESQTGIIDSLISKMNGSQANWIVSGINVGGAFGTYQDLLITARNPGPTYNDVFMEGNTNGGGSFNGLPKEGGWLFTSVATPGNASQVTVSFVNRSGIGNFTVRANYGDGGEIPYAHGTAEYVLNFKEDYLSVVMPHQWVLFHAADGAPYTPRSIEEVVSGGDNFWLCNPRIPDVQRLDPVTPLGYCGFSIIVNRVVPYEALRCSTRLNATMTEGPFNAFEVDCGISFIVLNAMYQAAGELATTAGKSISTASLVALSNVANGPLQIVGDVWGMYIESKYWPLDTLAMSTDGTHRLIAYRSQQAPCEMTLWLALS